MKSILTVIAICTIVISCNKKNINTTKEAFNLYGRGNELLIKNYQTFEKNILKSYDSINVFYGDKQLFCYNEKENNVGIFRSCGLYFSQSHSFDTIAITNHNDKCIIPFFLSKKTQLVNEKEFNIKGVNYKIFHYSEQIDSHKSFDSYYLKDRGFICYYNFDTDKYIFSNEVPKLLKDYIISDRDFFARYTMAKLFPNYYRVKSKKNSLW
ncbi:hypothetical protein OX284_004160 [Flavobacterium sp. SUN046]|uniref:hypothetical protein n=1 Tax=Flavobacterium sp. SUN046 TaxID=3002440 RepID=UPI002DBCA685|nr:hypothetical protein [Flavobacterium sp. SUN046]MEC4048612.1 hypothetical protein [Flavobacterium sp. SUN046]